MKIAIILLLLLVIVALVAAVVVLWGRRLYQGYSGLEQQRGAAKLARDAGVDRLKEAERRLVTAQRALVARGETGPAQAIEQLRIRLNTAADRHRYATHGYAPLDSAHPLREAELAELQAHDANTIDDAQLIADLSQQIAASAAAPSIPDLAPLEQALDHLTTNLDRRKALT